MTPALTSPPGAGAGGGRPAARPRSALRDFFLLGGQSRNAPMEGLRGYAVLLVFFVHAAGTYAAAYRGVQFDPLLTESVPAAAGRLAPGDVALFCLFKSHYGVDLFFFLSGFLVLRIVTRRRGDTYRHFLWRRVLRIYPPFLGSLLVHAWMLHAYSPEAPFDPVNFAKNLLLLYGCPYVTVTPYNSVTWSLFYEVAFYALFPLLFALYERARDGAPEWRPLSASLLLAAALPPALLMPRFCMFYFGSLMALVPDAGLQKLAAALPGRRVALAYLAATAFFVLLPLDWALFVPLYGAATGLLFVKACYGGGALGRLFALTPLRLLGNLSYSFYLIHTVGVTLCVGYLGGLVHAFGPYLAFPAFALVSFVIALALSAALFAVCERWYFVRRPA